MYVTLLVYSLLSSQDHRVAIQTVDIIVVAPGLLGIHTQSLTVHEVIQNFWGREQIRGKLEAAQREYRMQKRKRVKG